MMKRISALLCSVVLFLAAAMPALAAEQIPHGTAKEWITEDQLNSTPPAGYKPSENTQKDAKYGFYNAYFPDDQLQNVYIEIEDNNLNYLLQNAVDEPYVMTTSVTIGDTTLGYCGLKTKGNYTLYHSYHDNVGSDRFSFTVNFGKYITKEAYGAKQNFYGCEKISFNNFFFDKSMMKEYIAFKLMEEMGLPTPQHCLAKLYINGAYYGVYFMVEAMDETILEQYWNCNGKDLSDYLLKPTGTNLDYASILADGRPLFEHSEATYAEISHMFPTVLDWVEKLNQLSDGTDFDGKKIDVQSQQYIDLLETVLDLDEVIKYFAVSSWLCQMDNMFVNLQNYGLYLSEAGVATLLPWDYDLCFGCYYPSTSETTANYPLDVMYRLDLNQYGWEKNISNGTYDDFPLFYVIYQNQELMDRYHTYMAECSQIAALGGTVASTGKDYDPGYFHNCIVALQDELIAAATEKTADHVYYMNMTNQPADVTAALPNLSAIIAQRSVGVWVQVQGTNTTVSGAGCDLATLGNALTGSYANSGTLTTVDPATGIFATASYSGGRRALPPVMNITALNGDDTEHQNIQSALELSRRDTLLAYQWTQTVKANSEYTVTLPLSPAHLAEGTTQTFYTWSDGKLTELTAEQQGNLFTVKVSNPTTLVVLVSPPANGLLPILVAVGAVIVAAAVAVGVPILVRRKKNTPVE